MHQRQAIREAVKAQLLNRTAAGARVFESRTVPFQRLELPAIAVYTLSESVEIEGTAPRELKRTMELAIEAHVSVRPDTTVDDALDALAEEIERAMHADQTLGGTAGDAVLSSTDVGISAEGNRPTGVVGLTYSVTYRTYAPEASDVSLDDLNTADIKYSLENAVNPANQAEDKLQNLES